jgi:AcrR family transcriptional regulator
MSEAATGGRSATAADRRHALVQAAYARIAKQGFEGLRTRDVAADAGVNIATLHYYFPTKEALIRGVVGHALRMFPATLPRGGSPADQLREHLAALRDLLKTNVDLFVVLSELSLRASRDPVIAEIVQASDGPWYARIRALLQTGVQEGSFAANLDVDGAAALIVSAIKGVSLPPLAAARSERIDQTFRQLERSLGLA